MDPHRFGREIAEFALVALGDPDAASSARDLGDRARRAIEAAALGLVVAGLPTEAALAWAIAAGAAFDDRLADAVDPRTLH